MEPTRKTGHGCRFLTVVRTWTQSRTNQAVVDESLREESSPRRGFANAKLTMVSRSFAHGARSGEG